MSESLRFFRVNEISANIIPVIRDTKNEYDNAVKNLIVALTALVKGIFSKSNSSESLTSIIKDWYESLSDQTRQFLFTGNENKILELMANITNDESSFIQRLAKAATSLRIDDWNSDTVDEFLRDIKEFKKTVEDFNTRKEAIEAESASYEIIFTGANGEKNPKRFNKIEYSSRAKLLLNEMASNLDEYGQSITEQEKRQVLIELIEKLC